VVQSSLLLDQSLIAPDTLRIIRRDDYERMVEAGLFEGERIELVRGALVAMSPQGTRHAHVISGLMTLLFERLGRRAVMRCQMPFAAGADSVPEPDIAVVPAMDYSTFIPERAHLIIEVADSSLRKDRILKADLYAEAGVPEYWLVDLAHDLIEVRTLPADGKYARTDVLGPTETIRPAAFPDVELSVREILHPA
jgi:Uma2 family endonuclease